MYPTTGNYNINSYAPVDPMDQIQIPVFGYPQQQLPPNAASTSSVAQAQRVQPVAQMNSPGQPVQRSQSTTHPPHPQPGARSARTVSDRRQISTEEMRNDFNRAAPYIPTPINNSARTGLAQPPVVMSPQQLPSSSTRQSNTSVPVMLPNLTTANCQQKQQGPDPVVNNESSKRDRRRKQSIPQHNTPQQDSPVAQHPPRGHLPVARQPQVQPTPPGPPVLQRNALDTLLQQKREAVLEMVLQMDAIALQKMNTYIEYGDDREVFVKFKNLAVDRWYLIYLFKQYYMPIPDRLRGNGAHDNQSWPEDPPGYPLPNKQYPSYERLAKIQMEQNVMYSLRRTQGAQGHISQNLVNTQAQRLPNQAPPTRSPVPPGQMQRPPMPQLLHPQQMQMEQRMHLGHTVHPRQGPGFPANMQRPPSNMHGVPIQFLPHNGPPPTYVQYGPAAQQQQLQQLQQLQQQQQLQQHQIQQQRQMQQQFQHQPQLQPQQQFQNQPQFHQQRMLHNQQLQQHVQHQQQMQHRQHQLHQEQQRQQHQGPVPLAPPNQAPSQPPPTDSYPVVSADLPPPKSALSPGPVTSTEVPEDPVDTKPVVRREAPAPQDQPEQQAEPESMQKPVVRPIESPAVAENPVVAPSTARKRPPKPPKKRIEVITLDDDERPRVKQEVVDSEFQSSSSGRQGTISVKEEPPVRTFTQKEVDEMKEAFRKEMEEKNKQEIDEKVKAAVSIAVANEIKDLKEQFVMLKQASANVQHPETQEPQQTTIPEAVVTTQKPRSPSPSDSVVGRRQRARLRVVESDEENAEASNPIPEKTAPISTPSTNRTRTRPKTRLLMKDSDDDDEMPTPNKRRKRQVESDDDEYREDEEDETISECTASPILSEDEEEEDSMRDFIEEDDDSDEEEEEEEEESGELEMRKTATLRKIPKREVSSGRSSRETSETMNSTSGVQKESSASKLSTGVRPQRTAEELEALRKLRAMKARKTREENREKKHKAQLELMEQTPVRRTRGREATVHHPSSPLSEVLLDTIAIFQSKRGSEDDNPASKREKQGKSESVEKQREEQSKSNSESQHRTTSAHKRPIATEKNDELDTHTPSKRVAHSSSVSRPSRVRATPPVAKNRPNQMEMMDRRDKEKEENDKKLVEEIAFLKKKKFLTDGEQLRLRTLEKKVGPSQAQTPKPSSSSSKPSTSSNRIIKQEPRDIPEIPEKKRPPPKFLDPTKGRAFHKMRETNIERIFKILVDGHAGNPEQEAQRIELELATTYTTAAQYRIKSSHKVVQLKREYPPDIVPINKNAVSHERMIAGAAKENCTIAKGKSKIDYRQLSLDDLFPSLAQFKLSSAKLKENAYPLFKPNGRVVQIAETQYTVNKKVFLSNHDLKRSCCRCFKEFQVKNDGSVIREKDICRYHNRNMIRDGKRDTQRKRYQCCNEDFASASLGCKFVDTHVFDQMFTRDLEKFVSTPQPSSPTDPRSKNAFALDCEMVYTLEGSALARLSMVDMKGVKVLDVFIKPPSEVIDPNTEFSGLTLDQVNSATDTLATCHRKLFKYVNSETILIGHSLESDLKAMRVSHTSVIDTAVMYASVTNNKQSLKALSLKLLGKKIQNDNEDAVGHDSLEDALTCVDLIFHGLANPESVVYRNIP